MSDTLLMLRLEHRNTAELLDIIESQLGRLHRAEDIDCGLIGLVVDYLRSYGDACHHPKEDLIYHALRRRDLAAAQAVGDLDREHGRLARMTEALAGELVAAEQSRTRAARLKLKTPLAEFLAFYRRHLGMEEERFFPAALRALSAEDWDAIDFDTFDGADPLFSDAVEERFERLREAIDARSGAAADADPRGREPGS